MLNQLAFSLCIYGQITEIYVLLERVKRDYPDHMASVLDVIARELTKCDYAVFAYELLEHIKIESPAHLNLFLEGMAQGFATKGNSKETYKLLEIVRVNHSLQRDSLIKNISGDFARSGYKKEAYEFLEWVCNKSPLQVDNVLVSIAKGEYDNNQCIAKNIVLKTLLLLKPNVAKDVIEILKPFINDYLVSDLLPIVAEYNTSSLVKRYHLSFNQARAWIKPEVIIVLLQGIGLGKLKSELLFNIASFLLPMDISETRDLSNKLYVHYRSDRFFKQLGTVLAESETEPVLDLCNRSC